MSGRRRAQRRVMEEAEWIILPCAIERVLAERQETGAEVGKKKDRRELPFTEET